VTRPDHPQEGITLVMTTCNSRADVLVHNTGVILLGPSRSSSAGRGASRSTRSSVDPQEL